MAEMHSQNLNVSSCLKTMRSSGLLEAICNTLMGSGVPVDIISETIHCVREVIRGDMTNQEHFGSIMEPSSPPRPGVVVLLIPMANEKQSLPRRSSVLYCFECFFYPNEIGQTNLMQTLLPSSSEVSTLTAGQLLCGGLFSSDSLSNWFSSVSLMHGLIENPVQKEQPLRVLLATSVNSQPMSLLQQCTSLIQQSNYKFKSKIGLLMSPSTWQCYCELPVKALLSAPGSSAFLTAQIKANEHNKNMSLVQGLCGSVVGTCVECNDKYYYYNYNYNFNYKNDCSVTNYKRDVFCQSLVKRNLPTEILIQIFEYLTIFELFQIGQHGIHFKRIARDVLQKRGLTKYHFQSHLGFYENTIDLQCQNCTKPLKEESFIGFRKCCQFIFCLNCFVRRRFSSCSFCHWYKNNNQCLFI